MRTKTTLLLLIFYSALFGQTNADGSFAKNLTTWVNPKKDSIKTLKLKEALTYKITGSDKKLDFAKIYNQNGFVLMQGDYTFKYDAQNILTFIKYPDPLSRMKLSYDSVTIDKNVDSIKVLQALYLFNNTIYNKFMRDVVKKRNDTDIYSDTLKSCGSSIIRYNPKSKKDFDCSVTNLIRPNGKNYLTGYIETYKYDFGHQPPTIELSQKDTLGKFKKTYFYRPSFTSDDVPLFNGYNLLSIHTEIKNKDFSEDIYENYTDNLDNIFTYPFFIDHSKYYSTYEEHNSYKCSSAKSKKLVSSYIIKTEYNYFK